MHTWSSWKRFPDAWSGAAIDAPAGPGVYEVRHTLTGRAVAFGHTADTARALAALQQHGGVGLFARLFGRPLPPSRLADLEYRTCAAESRAEARITARRLLGLRQNAWRRRLDLGWTARHAG